MCVWIWSARKTYPLAGEGFKPRAFLLVEKCQPLPTPAQSCFQLLDQFSKLITRFPNTDLKAETRPIPNNIGELSGCQGHVGHYK